LISSNTHAYHEAWLVDSGPSFHMTPHREWFCEYERYDGGDVFLGDDSTTRIIGRGKVKLRLIDGRIRTLPSVLHILGLAINLIFVRKMDDAGVALFSCFSCCLDLCVHYWAVFWHMVYADGFLFPINELDLLTNPGHSVRVLDAAGSYMYILL
jgi:hypothetical protein